MTTVSSRMPVSGFAVNATPEASGGDHPLQQHRDAVVPLGSVSAPVGDHPLVGGGPPDVADGIQHRGLAGHPEDRLVLAGERGVREVLGERRGAHRERPVAEHRECLDDPGGERLVRLAGLHDDTVGNGEALLDEQAEVGRLVAGRGRVAAAKVLQPAHVGSVQRRGAVARVLRCWVHCYLLWGSASG